MRLSGTKKFKYATDDEAVEKFSTCESMCREMRKTIESVELPSNPTHFFEWWIKDTAEVFIQTVPFGACCLKENGKLQVAKTADVGESQRNQ